MYSELFISNYRQTERNALQLSMFDENTGGILNEKSINDAGDD